MLNRGKLTHKLSKIKRSQLNAYLNHRKFMKALTVCQRKIIMTCICANENDLSNLVEKVKWKVLLVHGNEM